VRRQTNTIKDIDWITIAMYTALVLMGWLNIYAAVYNEKYTSIFTLSQSYGKQMMWILAAFTLAIIACIIDVRFYTSLAYHIFVLCLLSLIAVLIVGKDVHNSKSWFAFGSIQIQPSEFAKIAVSLALSKYLGNYNGRLMQSSNLLTAMAIIFLPPLFIILQPDVGSCLTFLSFMIVLYREGLNPSILLFGIMSVVLFILSIVMQNAEAYLSGGLILTGLFAFLYKTRRGQDFLKALGLVAGLSGIFWTVNHFAIKHFAMHEILLFASLASASCFFIMSYINRMPVIRTITVFIVGALLFTFSVDFVFDKVLSAHHQNRILIMLGKKSDPMGTEYNVNQSKIAIGSGGFFGKGFLQGTQTKYNFVPAQSTDFIFCTVGEEWGFAGSAVVVILFVALLMRLLYIAERQRSAFSRVFCYCVLSVMLVHFTINIGMTIGLLPVIGIPLPFFSYGGSSLWSFTILLFIMLRLDASRGEYIR